MTITDSSNNIVFTFTADKILTVGKQHITEIFKKDDNTAVVQIGRCSNSYWPNFIELIDNRVSSPVHADIDALIAILQGYVATYVTPRFVDTFTNANLVAGVLTITHTLNTTDIKDCAIYTPAGKREFVSYTVVNTTTITVDFGGAIGAGTWKAVID